jgi:hypothetical protein
MTRHLAQNSSGFPESVSCVKMSSMDSGRRSTAAFTSILRSWSFRTSWNNVSFCNERKSGPRANSKKLLRRERARDYR